MIECIIISIIFGISCGIISSLIDFSFNDGNIFDWYYLFIIEKIKPINEKLFKLLGGCNRCFNFWLTIIVFISFNKFLFHINELYVFFTIAFSDLTNKIINKYE